MLPARSKLPSLLFVLAWSVATVASAPATAANAERWVTAWTTATFAETPGKETPPLKEMTLRQIVRVTAAGSAFRIRIGNYFGGEPLVIGAARVAMASKPGASDGDGWHAVRFKGGEALTVPPGEAVDSDPIESAVLAGGGLTVDLYVRDLPQKLTVHSASRATAYVFSGNIVGEKSDPKPAQTCTRWYFLSAVDVRSNVASAIAVMGDSIADGYGCPPDSYARWPDVLSRRLEANPATANIAVINPSIGGNRLLRDGLGPRGLSRIGRDVFAQHGVSALIVCLGINDIGTRIGAKKNHQPYASADDIIAGLRQVADDARQRGLMVIGATLTPYAGAGFYWSEDGEADRQAVNEWIRYGGSFDRVIDFDALLRDPQAPTHLLAAYDSGDHLHPSVAGYARMGESIDLAMFARLAKTPAPAAPAR